MATSQATIECTNLDELARQVMSVESPRIGVVTSSAHRDSLFVALSRSGNRVVRIPAESHNDRLPESLADLLPPTPNAPSVRTTPESVRDHLTAQLRKEQLAAQERVAAAKMVGGAAAPFDRDVAGWLAAGLGDLFADNITGEAFLKGAFARLAANPTESSFVEADFLRPDGIKFLEAGRPAQSMLTKLSLASTNQFRAAAVRLMNQIIAKAVSPAEEQSIGSRIAAALRSRNETLVLFVENATSVPNWVDADSPIRLIVAGEDEAQLRQRLSDSAVIFRYVEKQAVVAARPAILDDLQRWQRDLQMASARIVLFQRHGLLAADFPGASILRELPTDSNFEIADLVRSRELLASIEQELIAAWQHWFAEQLAAIDAEWFLQQDPDWDFLDIPRYMNDVHQLLLEPDENVVRLPVNEDEFAGAEKFIAALCELDRKWRTRMLSPVDEGMVFDAAVAAGGAPLDMLTDGVEWWLQKENKDWHKYRIVRVD